MGTGHFNKDRITHLERYRPLEPDQIPTWKEAAKDGKPIEELLGLTLLHTGIRRTTMAHMTEAWLNLDDEENPHVKIPPRQECTLGRGKQGSGGDTKNTGQPCYNCREKRPGYWKPKSHHGVRPIPIREEDVEEILRNYFSVHDTVGGREKVNYYVEKISDRADLGREVTPHDLRNTYGTRLARKGFTPHEIMHLMGHSSIGIARFYIKMSGTRLGLAYDEKW
ncbi:site-specific recombinase XerD [Halogeometricum borinquense DSM 11551]|uniref:Site-specific recombinase XerD n=1 Tax=Halogeometricum borinquense (strain ATCC 700274 / DSM 11551 / JCM 10706 / KCTC 4070 / PR3) TaxID=469382 RepID=E4NWS8_HALBP|nr:site-specific integrase [Halogeometricum borinquense]ADQ69498.1 site-specific recombinase XerD [Halogeometricum borinquense DSM 11551]ELY23048.1 site-specific recombinase XerD [Halogeometricum borinquense DSM 11551]